jgi:hypothetical protein
MVLTNPAKYKGLDVKYNTGIKSLQISNKLHVTY